MQKCLPLSTRGLRPLARDLGDLDDESYSISGQFLKISPPVDESKKRGFWKLHCQAWVKGLVLCIISFIPHDSAVRWIMSNPFYRSEN